MDQHQDRSVLFDAKMELQSDDSFADPTFSQNTQTSKPSTSMLSRCSIQLAIKIILVVLLIIAAFVGGYLVRRAVHDTANAGKQCHVKVQYRPRKPPSLNETVLDEMLADVSAQNIENNLRYVFALVISRSIVAVFIVQRCVIKGTIVHCF